MVGAFFNEAKAGQCDKSNIAFTLSRGNKIVDLIGLDDNFLIPWVCNSNLSTVSIVQMHLNVLKN